MGSVFEWISIPKAAEALEVSVRQVYAYIKQGQLTALQEGKKRSVNRKDVKALIDAKKKGIPRAINALVVLRMDAEIQVLKKQVETVMRLLDIRFDPLGLDKEDLNNLFVMAAHYLTVPWSPHEETMWCDVFVRMRLEDLEKIDQPDPWRPFLSLSKVMFDKPYTEENKLLLSSGKENMERIAFAWAHKVDRVTASALNHMLDKDGVKERRMDRRLENIQQKLKSTKE